MIIFQKEINKITAEPKALQVLKNIGDVPTYHSNYEVRHPLAAYNISLSHVAQRIINTIDILQQKQQLREFDNPKILEWENPLVDATDHMLDALMEHLEDCGGIIRSFFPSSEDNRYKKIHQEFKNSISPYRNHIGKIVNYMKHNQGRLRIISFSWGNQSSLGYFIEGPNSEGGLGPVAKIHPTEGTAFSYNRDIPYHICCIFAVSAQLAKALNSIDHRLTALTKITVANEEKPSDLSVALEKSSSLPLVFFEDELAKKTPKINLTEKSFSIEYPSQTAKPKSPPGGSKIHVFFRGDGVTTKYRVPYFNRES